MIYCNTIKSNECIIVNMTLSEAELELVERASGLVREREVSRGVVGEVGCALRTKNGEIFTGASMDLACGLGFCAEHTAIANMISHTEETQIDTIVAVGREGILPPCGRCRELMQVIDKNNRKARVIVSETEVVLLEELLPRDWME